MALANETAKGMLNRLIEMNNNIARSKYDTGRILCTFLDGELYHDLGYDTMGGFVSDALPYSVSTASAYASCYRNLKRLKYTIKESLALLSDYQPRTLVEILSEEEKKIPVGKIAKIYDAIERPFEFRCSMSAQESKLINRMLEQEYGLEKPSDKGRRANVGQSLTDALHELAVLKGYAQPKKQVA